MAVIKILVKLLQDLTIKDIQKYDKTLIDPKGFSVSTKFEAEENNKNGSSK